MSGMANDFAPMRFSTAALPERERVPMVCDFIGPVVARFDIEPLGDGPLHVEITSHAVPDLAVSTMAFSTIRAERTRALLADGSDVWSLSCLHSPGNTVVQRGYELIPNQGAGTLISMAEPFVCTTVAPITRATIISLPHKVLAAMVPDIDDRVATLVPDSEALRLLAGYVGLLDQHHVTSAELLRGVVGHVHDLVALALGPSRDAAEIARGRGLRAARLHAIKADIRDALGHPDLSVTTIAARHGVTPRYVQALFESDGTTFSQFLVGERLARAHRMLRDPLQASRHISAIAYAAGFSDLSYFNRAFRRRYGATPSDVRAGAQGEESE
jgi:AraC-like DNA-binding protein